MLVNKDLKKLFSELNRNSQAELSLAGSVITIKVWDGGQKLYLSAPVYWGGNYIPKSVRSCLAKRAPFDEKVILTSLAVDEAKFEVTLVYQGSTVYLDGEKFNDLLQEFSFLAAEWREWLDQHDKNDLVHVRSL